MRTLLYVKVASWIKWKCLELRIQMEMKRQKSENSSSEKYLVPNKLNKKSAVTGFTIWKYEQYIYTYKYIII
jgi:hypothetical protein